jgi:hypothetical protein
MFKQQIVETSKGVILVEENDHSVTFSQWISRDGGTTGFRGQEVRWDKRENTIGFASFRGADIDVDLHLFLIGLARARMEMQDAKDVA